MAYDLDLAQRIRAALKGRPGISEREMFGGIAFLMNGYMFVGIADSSLMARVGPDRYPHALSMRHVREMDFTGRPMKGYVFVSPEALRSGTELKTWISWCTEFVSTLPAKKKTTRKTS